MGRTRWKAYAASQRAVKHCRERRGPALLHAHVTRPYSHSLSDDEKLYKTPEERETEAHRDPIPKFGLFLVREGILDEKELEALEAGVEKEIIEATDRRACRGIPGGGFHLRFRVLAGCGSHDDAFAAAPVNCRVRR